MKKLYLFLVIISLTSCTGSNSSQNKSSDTSSPKHSVYKDPLPSGVKLAKTIVVGSFESFIDTGEYSTSIDWKNVIGIDEQLQAVNYYKEYAENEISADNKFKGKSINVRGVVESINKDFQGKAFLTLHVPNSLYGVRANIKEEEIQNAAKLKRGSDVGLVCTGGGMMIGAPILNDCLSEKNHMKIVIDRLNAAVDDAFHGKPLSINDDSGKLRALMLIGYYTALKDSNMVCQNNKKECGALVEKTINSLELQSKKRSFDKDVILAANILKIDVKTLSFAEK